MKVLILGSTGFVGRNIAENLSEKITVIQTSRAGQGEYKKSEIYFDLFSRDSWMNIVDIAPDVLINAVAYGVVKLETDHDILYKTNYLFISDLYKYLQDHGCRPFWLQLGTAFEYDLSVQEIREESPCLPRTHYGISKLMMSNYLQSKGEAGNFSVMRPFGMFGKYEDESKFFPYLINAQKKNSFVDLSSGTQKRDYIYVKDLGHFINKLLVEKKINDLPSVLNVGSGKAMSFLEYASLLQASIPSFKTDLWQWGKIDFRPDESPLFYSASKRAAEFGFMNTAIEEALGETVSYYFSK
ncbi:MAG TPA: NAD(P)-dependent oxidoreductase [Puia sp.]|nr:NAD(P)-dependent oxidoreductase [Puia sp.]